MGWVYRRIRDQGQEGGRNTLASSYSTITVSINQINPITQMEGQEEGQTLLKRFPANILTTIPSVLRYSEREKKSPIDAVVGLYKVHVPLCRTGRV